MLIAISGVSGAGKNTIINELTKKWDLHFMPTAITREMRKTEFDMHPYFFISEKEFKKREKRNEFYETCEVHKGTYYGTLKSIYNKMTADGKILIKDLDVDGVTTLKNKGVDVLWIFIKTSSLGVLKERLQKRGNTPDDIKKRLSRAEYELPFEKQADYVVINDNLKDAVSECEKIIEIELKKRKKTLKLNNRKDFIVVYNKSAGKGRAANYARKICDCLATNSDVELVHSDSPEFIKGYFSAKLNKTNNLCVVVVGGDGTLGSTIDAVLASGSNASIAVFPCGTANDFSRSIGIKKRINGFVDMLRTSKPQKVDVALVNNSIYSIHAIGAGNFGHGSTQFSSVGKKRFGMLAYWLKSFFAAFKMKPAKLEICIDGKKIEDEFLFFYATNGIVAGGFNFFAPFAKIDDGKFDFIGVKKCNIFHFSWVVARLIFGKHTKSSKVVAIKGKNIDISAKIPNKTFEFCDIDGNKGPKLPLKIEVLPQKISIFTKTNN